jgi:hypothetical protein
MNSRLKGMIAVLLVLALIVVPVYAATTVPGWVSAESQNRIDNWFTRDQKLALYSALNDLTAAGGMWSTLGNAGTTSGTHFLGTTDNKPLQVKTNNLLRLAVAGDGSVNFGNVDGTAYDVTFWSDTVGDYMLWDQSEEALTIIGTNGQDALNVDDGNVDIEDDLDVNGTTNLDDVDIDLSASLNIDGELVDIGTCTTPSTANGDNDLCVAGDTEVDGELELDGALDADSTADIADTLTLSKASGNALVVSAGGAIDLNGNLDMDGSSDEAQLAVTGYTTQTADLVQFDGGLTDIGGGTYTVANGDNDLGVDGDLEVNTALAVAGAVTFGIDGTASDVVFYSDTTGDYFRWDQSAEALVITGTNAAVALDVKDGNVDIEDQLNVNGAVDLDSTLAVAGKVTAESDLEVDDWFILDVGAATVSVAVTEQISLTTGSYMLVSCSAGGGCTPASPALADGTEVGQILILQITGSNDITITDDYNTQLGAATRVLTAAKGDLIMLMWNGTDWFEINFTDVN